MSGEGSEAVDFVSTFDSTYGLQLLDSIDAGTDPDSPTYHSSFIFQYSEQRTTAGELSGEGVAARAVRRHEPVLVEAPIAAITPAQSPPWVGVFEGGGFKAELRTTVLTMPDPESFCVLKGGLGYLVNAERPDEPRRIDSTPVRQVRVVPEHEIVLFADFTDLVAYGRHGKLWESGRLAWDWLKIISVEDTTIFLTGFNAPADDDAYPFTVDLFTGQSSDSPYLG